MLDTILHIVLCFDDRVLAPALVAIATAIKNCTRYKVSVHVVSNNLSSAAVEALSKVCKLYGGVGFEFCPVDLTPFLSISRTHKNIPLEAYLNFLIPSALPSIDKVIYMDADTLVRGDFSDLWEMDFKGFVCLASDKGWTKKEWCRKETGLTEKDVYVNNGVMLLDLDAFRRDKLEERLVSAAIRYGATMNSMDQDVFNIELRGRIGNISNLWNFTTNEYGRDDKAHRKQAKVHHYTGVPKPWQGAVEWRDRLWHRESLAITCRLNRTGCGACEYAARLLKLNIWMWTKRIVFFWQCATFRYEFSKLATKCRIVGAKIKKYVKGDHK